MLLEFKLLIVLLGEFAVFVDNQVILNSLSLRNRMGCLVR